MNRTRDTGGWITAFDWTRADAMDQAQALLATGVIPALASRPRVAAPEEEVLRFGRYVAALRRSSGWGRAELARRMEIDPLAVLLLERAELSRTELSDALVERVARAFAIPTEALVVVPAPEAASRVRQPLFRWSEVMDAVRALLVPLQTGLAHSQLNLMTRSSTRAAGQEEAQGADEQVLGSPTPPFSLVVEGADGSQVQVLLTLLPLEFPEPNVCDLQVEVWDEHHQPVAGLLLELELDGLTYYVQAATDAAGTARFEGLPLSDLLQDEPPLLRVRWAA